MKIESLKKMIAKGAGLFQTLNDRGRFSRYPQISRLA